MQYFRYDSREQFRTIILCEWKIGLVYKESHARLVQAWWDQAPSDRIVLNWFHEFQGRNFMLPVQVVLQLLSTKKQLLLSEQELKMILIEHTNE